jgi:hypothetical protein
MLENYKLILQKTFLLENKKLLWLLVEEDWQYGNGAII